MFGSYHALNNLDVSQVAFKHSSALILTERKILKFSSSLHLQLKKIVRHEVQKYFVQNGPKLIRVKSISN